MLIANGQKHKNQSSESVVQGTFGFSDFSHLIEGGIDTILQNRPIPCLKTLKG